MFVNGYRRGIWIFLGVWLMGTPEDLLKRLRGVGEIRPIPPSDLELIVRELQYLKMEIDKIKTALKKHGIEVD